MQSKQQTITIGDKEIPLTDLTFDHLVYKLAYTNPTVHHCMIMRRAHQLTVEQMLVLCIYAQDSQLQMMASAYAGALDKLQKLRAK